MNQNSKSRENKIPFLLTLQIATATLHQDNEIIIIYSINIFFSDHTQNKWLNLKFLRVSISFQSMLFSISVAHLKSNRNRCTPHSDDFFCCVAVLVFVEHFLHSRPRNKHLNARSDHPLSMKGVVF